MASGRIRSAAAVSSGVNTDGCTAAQAADASAATASAITRFIRFIR
jgi:hypothetical protein